MDFYQDPCCGISLYRGVKVIAIIDLVTSIFSTVMSGFGFLIALFDGNAILNDFYNYDNNGNLNATVLPDGGPVPVVHIGVGWLIFSLFVITLLNLLYVYLARFLLHAAQERNTVKLQRWFDITAVILAIRVLGYIPMIFVEGGAIILFGIMWCTYTAYSLWVVHALRKQLLTEGESNLLRDTVYYSRDYKVQDSHGLRL